MGFSRTKKQDPFWQIVGEMEWKLDDGRGGRPKPPDEPEFDHSGGGGRVWPRWTTHVIAFLVGGLVSAGLFVEPPILIGLGAALVGALLTIAYRRWD